MSREYNIYCDESCHLENDRQKAMVLGLILCDKTKRKEITIRVNEIKQKHNLAKNFEIKWTKVSPAKIDFYLDLVDYFIENFNNDSVKCWKNKRGNDTNILLFFEEQNYLVVLADRGEFVLPWTAYQISYNNRKKYEEYQKNRADDAIC